MSLPRYVSVRADHLKQHMVIQHKKYSRFPVGSKLPRRQIAWQKKMQALEALEMKSPEKWLKLQELGITPNSLRRIRNQKDKILKRKVADNKACKKLNFRDSGAGRKVEKWWQRIEPDLLRQFQERRDKGIIVLPIHILSFIYDTAAK
jgi:hypothetical protein